ncbi:collagenase-like [Pollicipes pollicipes]|uniref:collagenase-like n=1 Tax=Pollicipes pollicipes TaxID=41117 RepID=UPI001885533F|nr:collagenase-like [Pollicipes pollicipes]XP_037078020.1 collagenase-like [Pollicipes pollicipes]XP_037078021.1 collagenase-like [Pollicipes pollicipes]
MLLSLLATILLAGAPSARAIFPLTGLGACEPRVLGVDQGRALHLSSDNYPLTYPRGACQRHRLRPDSANTSVSLVCTDVDLDSLVVPWLNWRFWGDFLTLPGRGMVYGREWFQCDTAPLSVEGAPGEEVALEFSANYLLQRRGYSCMARGLDADSRRGRQLSALRHKESRDCGRSRVHRIVDGKNAKLGEVPFVVYVVTRTAENKKLYCAATLISRRFLLTAAHCLEQAVWSELRLGTLDVSLPGETSFIANATRFRQHPQWGIHKYNREHDIGLIELSENITFTDYIQPICLPTVLELEDQYVNEEASIAGWGKTYQGQHGGSFILQVAKVRVIGNCECAQRWPFHITPLKMCSSPTTGKQTHCSGDSGGPLMVLQGGRWTQVGISSFVAGAGCETGDPAGYTRVGPYISWIRDHTDVDMPMM